MQDASHVRPGRIDLRVNRPLANRATSIRGSIDTPAMEVHDDQVFRLQLSPAHRAGFYKNPLLVQAGAQMAAEAVSRRLDGVEHLARLHQFFAKG